jgi:chemotaxis protein MotB
MTTYADAITLLMAFFAMLVSFSKVDLEVFDQVASGLAKDVGQRVPKASKSEQIKEELKDIMVSQGADQAVTVSNDSKGVTLELDGSAFFRPGTAILREEALPVLQSAYEEMGAPKYKRFNFEIEGHSDDDPINTPRYPSNWDLSAGRAATVVRFFEGLGMKPNRMKAVGFGSTQPKVPNRTEEGTPIPENQAINRRVVIRINQEAIYEPIKIPTFRRKQRDTAPVPKRTAQK